MKLIYIAGPFRGENSWEMEQNIRRAEALALEVWKMGAAAICPHANTRFFQGAAPDKNFLEGDLEILRRCDYILLTENWEISVGATAEREEAIRMKIPIFYAEENGLQYLKESIQRATYPAYEGTLWPGYFRNSPGC
jgi:hypothetical protein